MLVLLFWLDPLVEESCSANSAAPPQSQRLTHNPGLCIASHVLPSSSQYVGFSECMERCLSCTNNPRLWPATVALTLWTSRLILSGVVVDSNARQTLTQPFKEFINAGRSDSPSSRASERLRPRPPRPFHRLSILGRSDFPALINTLNCVSACRAFESTNRLVHNLFWPWHKLLLLLCVCFSDFPAPFSDC